MAIMVSWALTPGMWRLVGTAHFDGKGNLTSGSARVVIVGGTPPPVVNEDFVITKAHFIHGINIATEVQDAQEEFSVVVSMGSGFVTHVFTRRPDDE